MEYKTEIEKIHKGTCNLRLKKASKLTGSETEKELLNIYSKCLDIQGINLLNDIRFN